MSINREARTFRSWSHEFLTVVTALACAISLSDFAQAQVGVWQPQGPAPTTEGQVENIADGEVVGAVHAVAPHPTDANTLYIGTVNGGIWRTNNALAASPNWVPLTDTERSLSITALEFDPTDTTNMTLLAGIGRVSNILGAGGARSGLLRTTDGGATWDPIPTTIIGPDITGVAARGATLVIADRNVGILRSVDTGATWNQVLGGGSFDLEGASNDQARLYADGVDAAGIPGLFTSDNTGATWNRADNAAIQALAPYVNVQLATGFGRVVYAAIAVSVIAACQPQDPTPDVLAGVFRSADDGANWVAMDIPGTNEAPGIIGINPGCQARNNLSLEADPARANANFVYVGGDRQPGGGENVNRPTVIDAETGSGRLFRGNANLPAGTQFVHLTHSNTQGPTNGGTASNTSPHADSRDMAFDANGNLIEVDDGGVYRRTQPQNNTGDWFSVNGDLQVTEFHSVAWDGLSNRIIGGAQDTGTPEQPTFSGTEWVSATLADGAVVAIDDTSSLLVSERFFSTQNLNANNTLSVATYDSEGVLQDTDSRPLSVQNGGNPITAQFYTPVVSHSVNGQRLVIGGGAPPPPSTIGGSVYESDDGGETVTEISTGPVVNSGVQGEAMAYGTQDNPDILYIGVGTQVWVRTGPDPGSVLTQSPSYPATGNVFDIAIDPRDSTSAYVLEGRNIYHTSDAGAGDPWTDITGNLAFQGGVLRSVAIAIVEEQEAIVVGTNRGVFQTSIAAPGEWTETCSGLPNAPVLDLEFEPSDKLLLAGTLGRGAWTCSLGRSRPRVYPIKFVCGVGDDSVVAAGTYKTAINILRPAGGPDDQSAYRRNISVALPGEVSGGQSLFADGPVMQAGESVELDCSDIVAEAAGLCSGDFCKGFVNFETFNPLEIVAVYTSADSSGVSPTGLHTERVSLDQSHCSAVTVNVPSRTWTFVPPHQRGDRDFDGHGPCVDFDFRLQAEDNGSVLVANYAMQAFECSDDFAVPRSDFTTADGNARTIIYAAGPGGRIRGLSVNEAVTAEFVDQDHAVNSIVLAADDPLIQLDIVGDTDGSESGTKTRATITTAPITLNVETCSIAGGSF